MIERAAALQNTTVSGFVVNSALDAATHVIREHERIVLDARDWDVFLDALLDPPDPSATLRDAVQTRASLTENPEAK